MEGLATLIGIGLILFIVVQVGRFLFNVAHRRNCPYCRKAIDLKASKCPYCQSVVEPI
jgi:predicted Zn-ribbon and HTH transcriptional regulator